MPGKEVVNQHLNHLNSAPCMNSASWSGGSFVPFTIIREVLRIPASNQIERVELRPKSVNRFYLTHRRQTKDSTENETIHHQEHLTDRTTDDRNTKKIVDRAESVIRSNQRKACKDATICSFAFEHVQGSR